MTRILPPPEFDAFGPHQCIVLYRGFDGVVYDTRVYTRHILPSQGTLPVDGAPCGTGNHVAHGRSDVGGAEAVGTEDREVEKQFPRLFGGGKIEKRCDGPSKIACFIQSNPAFRRPYEQLLKEHSDLLFKRSEMEGCGRSKRYINKHAPIAVNVEDINHVMNYVSNHL